MLVGLFGLFCIWLYRRAVRGSFHVVSLMVALLVLLDLVYFPNAGSIGSVLFYFFPLILLPIVFLNGPARYTGVAIVMVNWSALLVLEGLVPGLVTPFKSVFDRLLDLWTGMLVASVAVILVTTVVLSWYHRERGRLKATVAELDASRDQLAELFRQHSDAVLVIDPETRTVLQVNDKFIRLSGVSAEEIVGRTTRDFNLWRHQSDRDRFYEAGCGTSSRSSTRSPGFASGVRCRPGMSPSAAGSGC